MNNYEWCRKKIYEVEIELGCYKIDKEHPLLAGFVVAVYEGERYAAKLGINSLEKNKWITSPAKPYIITGTVGERWPVKERNLAAYDINKEDITTTPKKVSTKDPSDQEFLVGCRIPVDKQVVVIPSYAFREDGTIDESQVMTSNLPDSNVPHDNGDYVIAKHIEGKPEYMDLPEEVRNTKEIAELYDPRIVNGRVMERTYDHAKTKEEIKAKYAKKEENVQQLEQQPFEPFTAESEEKLKKIQEETITLENIYNSLVNYFYQNPNTQELPREAQMLILDPTIDGKLLVEQAKQKAREKRIIDEYKVTNPVIQYNVVQPIEEPELSGSGRSM